MPSVDVKWPSEDEEFDTVATATATKSENKPENNQDGDAVPVNLTQTSTVEPSLAPDAPAEPQAESSPDPAPEAAQPADDASSDSETPELSAAAQAEETPSEPEEKSEEKTPLSTAALATAPAAAAVVPAVKAGKGKGGKLHFSHVLGYVVLIALLAGLAYWAFGLMSENKDLKNKVTTLESQVSTLNNNPAIVEQRKTDELITKVAALMEVPQNERPQAALVSDAASLKKQYPFFANVTNGDQILFYYQAGKVIVYRPSTNKIVQTGPLSISQATTATTPAKTTSTTKR